MNRVKAGSICLEYSGWLVYIYDMEVIGIYEAKTRLSELVRDALDGKEVIIARHGKPAVRLVPMVPGKDDRELGFFARRIRIAADFDVTPDDLGERS
jgi:prevent-host-death family protein